MTNADLHTFIFIFKDRAINLSSVQNRLDPDRALNDQRQICIHSVLFCFVMLCKHLCFRIVQYILYIGFNL
jgi:hypothetical protein